MPTAFIILGDTLPYLKERIAERYPTATLVSVYLHDGLPGLVRGHFPHSLPSHEWSPSSPVGLRDFLLDHLPDDDIEGVVVLEWTPSTRAFPEIAARVSNVVEQLVREATGGWVTSAAFARAWAHNLFTNYLTLDTWYVIKPHNSPVVIAASGPSLRTALPELARRRSDIALIALPSSLEALEDAGLTPDLVVAADAGYWAQTHLRSLDRNRPTPVACPLISARGLWRAPTLPVVFSSGSIIERELFNEAGVSPFEIASTGTVAAAAVELATKWTDGPVIFAGLDLCFEGLSEHVRPHSFDTILEIQSNRAAPLLTVVLDRLVKLGARYAEEGVIRTPGMQTYAGWFRELRRDTPIYRLFPSRTVLPDLHELDAVEFDRLLGQLPRQSAMPRPALGGRSEKKERLEVLDSLLQLWNQTVEVTARRISKEDVSLVLTEERRATAVASSLSPREYVRFRQAVRSLSETDAARLGIELFESAAAEIGSYRRRYLS